MSARPGPRDPRAGAVIRAPNHLGELILALPALVRAAESWAVPPVIQVRSALAPILRMASLRAEILELNDRRRVFRAASEVRASRPDVGILLTPSFSGALIFRLAGVRSRRGTATDARRWLLTDPIRREPLRRNHRVLEYLALADVRPPGEDSAGEVAGPAPDSSPRGLPRPRLPGTPRAREAWRELSEREGLPGADADGGRRIGLFPGGNAPSRRWDADRFADLAARRAGRGDRVVVFGGPGEARLTAEVAADLPGVHDLGGRTDLYQLAGGLETCDALVTNDSGPMHLAAALGRPVIALMGAGDRRQTRPLGSPVRVLARTDLPCVPCRENRCPRRGAGYVLDEARRECLRLIGVKEVEGALDSLLREASDGG